MPRAKKPNDAAQAPAESTAGTSAEELAPTPPAGPAKKAKDTPKRIKLSSPYGYYDDDGVFHNWVAGHETGDADEIATLVGRGAEHEVLET